MSMPHLQGGVNGASGRNAAVLRNAMAERGFIEPLSTERG